MKDNVGLVEYAKAQLGKPYWWGTFGQVATESLYKQKKKQYPDYYTATDFQTQYGKEVHDCGGLVKGYLWKQEGKIYYVPAQDKNVDGMWDNCTTTGTIETIPEIPGVLVFLPGHLGIYIGNGKVVEARGHAYGVVETNLKDRPWTKWGKLKWIEYRDKNQVFTEGQGVEAIEYLVKMGRILEKDKAISKMELIKDEEWIFIKWANDVLKLGD